MSKLISRLLVVLAFGWAGSVSAVPITAADIITVDGTDWAQVDLFTNLTWNDINTVCPSGVCGAGTLNSYDMEGWLWASIGELQTLFNSYLSAGGVPGSQLLGGTNELYFEDDSTWAPAFFADGWRSTFTIVSGVETTGYLSDHPNPTTNGWARLSDSASVSDGDAVRTFHNTITNNSDPWTGGWFYWVGDQPPNVVPTPATIPLLGLGLAALGFSRRKRMQHNLAA